MRHEVIVNLSFQFSPWQIFNALLFSFLLFFLFSFSTESRQSPPFTGLLLRLVVSPVSPQHFSKVFPWILALWYFTPVSYELLPVVKKNSKNGHLKRNKEKQAGILIFHAYVQGGGQSSLVFSTVLLRHSGSVPLQFLYLCLSEDVRMNWRIPPREPFHQFVSHLNRNIDLQFRSNSRVQKTVYDGLNFALN